MREYCTRFVCQISAVIYKYSERKLFLPPREGRSLTEKDVLTPELYLQLVVRYCKKHEACKKHMTLWTTPDILISDTTNPSSALFRFVSNVVCSRPVARHTLSTVVCRYIIISADIIYRHILQNLRNFQKPDITGYKFVRRFHLKRDIENTIFKYS